MHSVTSTHRKGHRCRHLATKNVQELVHVGVGVHGTHCKTERGIAGSCHLPRSMPDLNAVAPVRPHLTTARRQRHAEQGHAWEDARAIVVVVGILGLLDLLVVRVLQTNMTTENTGCSVVEQRQVADE